MWAYLLYAVMKLSAIQHFEDGSGLVPLTLTDTTDTRIVYCLPTAPCALVGDENGQNMEYVGGDVSFSTVPNFPHKNPFSFTSGD